MLCALAVQLLYLQPAHIPGRSCKTTVQMRMTKRSPEHYTASHCGNQRKSPLVARPAPRPDKQMDSVSVFVAEHCFELCTHQLAVMEEQSLAKETTRELLGCAASCCVLFKRHSRRIQRALVTQRQTLGCDRSAMLATVPST